jgi:hypothetical protein
VLIDAFVWPRECQNVKLLIIKYIRLPEMLLLFFFDTPCVQYCQGQLDWKFTGQAIRKRLRKPSISLIFRLILLFPILFENPIFANS